MTTTGYDPVMLVERLEQIERDLHDRQADLEAAARAWFTAKRDREKARAVVFLGADGTVAERQAVADRETALLGRDQEAEWEAVRAVVRTLETRASIGQTLLRSLAR